jgi:hypothetical protein
VAASRETGRRVDGSTSCDGSTSRDGSNSRDGDGAVVERKACYVQRRQLRGTWKQRGAGAAV